jgi:nucleotide-binding universal stress UspA family protein
MTAVSAAGAEPATTSETPAPETTSATQGAAAVIERFVVGVDGSALSVDALRWARRIAAGIGAHIDVVTTWEPRLDMPGPFVAGAEGTLVGPENDAQALLERTVEAAYGNDHPPGVTMRARQGDPAHILIEESGTAQLLVIGSRGLGQVAGLLLGSVSARCAEQARCPVLIMHAADQL